MTRVSDIHTRAAAPGVSQPLYTFRNTVDMLPFTYPELKNSGTDWYVAIKAINPRSGRLERRRYRINYIKNLKNRKRSAQVLIRTLTEKLESGWNPFIEGDKQKFKYVNIIDALDEMLKIKQAFVRAETFRTYRYRIGTFKKWLYDTGLNKIFAYEFTAEDARKFMDYVLINHTKSKRTFNNYLLDITTFFNELKTRSYTAGNPFSDIRRLAVDEKAREAFTRHELRQLSEYLIENDFDFYIIFQYTYICALRPAEIARLKVEDVDLRKGYIHVSGKASKTHKPRIIPIISKHFLEVLRRYLRHVPAHYYLASGFTSSGKQTLIKPGLQPVARGSITKKFIRIAQVLGFRKGLTFYSAKDTLAGHLIDLKEDITLIQKILGHYNLTSTQAYIAKRKPVVSDKAKRIRF